jgi:L-asparaginase / beta-aspartyl-peptidase
MRTARGWIVPVFALVLTGCARDDPPGPRAEERVKVVLVVHGGAGVLTDDEMKAAKVTRADFEDGLTAALKAGYAALQAKDGTGVRVVEAAIRVLEDSELFNAGRGAALDEDGQPALDAAIMEGTMTGKGEGKADPRKRAGAVAAISHVKNPISAARAVMEMKDSRHVLLVGEGAESFALRDDNREKYQIERVTHVYFLTDRRLKQVSDAQSPKRKQSRVEGADRRFGTVGAVALDARGLTAGTSTGGLTNKMRGRVGDSPLLGAGTYADDRACGVSCTGTGEVFIRHAVAHDVVARMLYGKRDVDAAVRETINELPDEPEGVGGLIALDARGRAAFGMSEQSLGMYRGYVTDKGEVYVGVYKDEPRRVGAAK